MEPRPWGAVARGDSDSGKRRAGPPPRGLGLAVLARRGAGVTPRAFPKGWARLFPQVISRKRIGHFCFRLCRVAPDVLVSTPSGLRGASESSFQPPRTAAITSCVISALCPLPFGLNLWP